MNASLSDSEIDRVSELVGDIYDCAIDPGRWPRTLQGIRDLLICANAVLYVFDTEKLSYRMKTLVGVDAEWASRMHDYEADIGAIYNYLGNLMTRPLDDYFVLRHDLPDGILLSNPYFREWAQPQGISDLIQATLMREPARMALLAMGRFDRDGRISTRELRLMDLLAPHLRRAVKISDIIDMKAIEAATLSATLDAISAPVFIVAADRTVLYANHAAHAQLEHEAALRLGDGRLHASDPALTARLVASLQPDAMRGGGIDVQGVVLSGRDGTPVIAHILPLSLAPLGGRLLPDAAAAILLAPSDQSNGRALAAVSEAFGLTPAETRVLERLLAGANIAEASKSLGIVPATTKTHLSRVLSKTGARRQADLLAMVNSLTSVPLGNAPRDTAKP